MANTPVGLPVLGLELRAGVAPEVWRQLRMILEAAVPVSATLRLGTSSSRGTVGGVVGYRREASGERQGLQHRDLQYEDAELRLPLSNALPKEHRAVC